MESISLTNKLGEFQLGHFDLEDFDLTLQIQSPINTEKKYSQKRIIQKLAFHLKTI